MAEKELCNLNIFVVAKWEPHVRNGDSICCQMSVQVYIFTFEVIQWGQKWNNDCVCCMIKCIALLWITALIKSLKYINEVVAH